MQSVCPNYLDITMKLISSLVHPLTANAAGLYHC